MYCTKTYPGYVDVIILVADLSQKNKDLDSWIRLILLNMKKGSKLMIFGSKADHKKQECVENIKSNARYFDLKYI